MKIVTVAAQKGGTGKTTTSAALAQAAAAEGRKTLLIDTDPQGNASLIYGADTNEPGVYDLITGKGAKVQHTAAGDIIASNPRLANADIQLANTAGRDFILKESLKQLAGVYDLIVIDTAPGMGTLLIQALTAAQCCIIPALTDSMSLSGLHQLRDTIAAVQRYCNPDLTIAGVVLTRYNAHSTLSKQLTDLFRKQCAEMEMPFAETHIREAVSIREAQTMRRSLYEYAPDSKPAQDYKALIKELKI